MKKILLIALVVLLIGSLVGYASGWNGNESKTEEQNKIESQQIGESDVSTIANFVKNFGSKLQSVSLLAPEDDLKKSMQENYGSYVSQILLSKWISNPLNAPGRLTSSPWPDRIEILSVEKLSEYEYEVKGEIIEITSVEEVNGGIAAKRPIALRVKKTDNRWLIDDVVLGAYEQASPIIYTNMQYGFKFSLPDGWKEYKIVADKWEGNSFDSSQGEQIAVETGPMISIRHPEWTNENPRQDIPIMIFTLAQWNMLLQEKFHIGAAGIAPMELGRNSGYVFALPARYNFAFPTGYEEVENILKNNPLQPIPVKQ